MVDIFHILHNLLEEKQELADILKLNQLVTACMCVCVCVCVWEWSEKWEINIYKLFMSVSFIKFDISTITIYMLMMDFGCAFVSAGKVGQQCMCVSMCGWTKDKIDFSFSIRVEVGQYLDIYIA
jgi:hypothetical protein